jgi:hypothetical protein
MAPRAALKRPDAEAAGHATPANRRVGFKTEARAKPADGADSFVTQVKFAERPGRNRGASASSSSSTSRTPPADAGERGTSGKSGGSLLNRLFGGGSRRDAEPTPAASTAGRAPHAPHAVPPARTSDPGAAPQVAKFNDLVMAFMESGADHGQKERLSKALAGGTEGFRKFLMSGEINRVVDKDAGRLLMDLGGALRKLTPADELEIRLVRVKPQPAAGR